MFLPLILAWRLIWAFVGNAHSRWKAILPIGRGFFQEVSGYLRGLRKGNAPSYLGHNPLGRMMITLLLLMMFSQALTGLVLAGTDLYKPPFGGVIAEWVTEGDPIKLANLKPGSKEFVDPAAYAEMRGFRKPVITIHLYGFYILIVAGLLHIVAVVVTEVREKSGLISAMITGEKVLSTPPVDAQSNKSGTESV